MALPDPAGGGPAAPVCYRHPGRETYVRCVRCDRPICPECMTPASVGFQCPECVRAGNAGVRQARTPFGGRVSASVGTVTKVLVAVNVLMFLVQKASPGVENRLLLVGLYPPVPFGGAIGVGAGQWYRLLTATFLHGGVLHILFNMYALWLFGPELERAFGRVRFVVLYLLSGLGGSAASYAFTGPTHGSLGASGAIFGLFAAFFVVSRKLGRDSSGLVVMLVLNVALAFTPGSNIDWRAHAGGFVTGGALAACLVMAPKVRRSLVQALAAAAIVVALVAVVTVHTANLIGSSPGRVFSCEVSASVDPGRAFLDCVAASHGLARADGP